MKHLCPACHWPHLKEEPRSKSGGASYEICPACGFQSGVTDDDKGQAPAQWRADWVKRGMPWSSVAGPAPAGWNPATILKNHDR